MGLGSTFLDLFASAGGLSEGFIQAGFEPVAHVESNKAACYSLRTRSAYHWLKGQNRVSEYVGYLEGKLTRHDLYSQIPVHVLDSIINADKSYQGSLRTQPEEHRGFETASYLRRQYGRFFERKNHV